MFWSFSFHLMPDETILEDSTSRSLAILKSTYSVFLTNKRVIFRFDGMGSSLAQSFLYREIDKVQPSKRLMINYLCVQTSGEQYFLHTPEPAYWAERILKMKKSASQVPEVSRPAEPAGRTKKQDLVEMLTTLRKYNLLTDAELAGKIKLLEKQQL
ncbi:MAG TPA: PH domain-containing protein [Nitrospirota bacterium]|nr:PH domain-containing protein [Nitrospirota bacterium]